MGLIYGKQEICSRKCAENQFFNILAQRPVCLKITSDMIFLGNYNPDCNFGGSEWTEVSDDAKDPDWSLSQDGSKLDFGTFLWIF